MNINNYYTVAEAAEKLQISKQAVYKRLTTDLKQGLMLIDGQKYIKSDIIDSLVNSKVDTTRLKVEKPNEQPLIESELIKALKSHIESLEKQNERLNNQIERLQYSLMTEQERVKELSLPPVSTIETKKETIKEPVKADTEIHAEQVQQKKPTVTKNAKTTNQISTADLLKMRKPQLKKKKRFIDWLLG